MHGTVHLYIVVEPRYRSQTQPAGLIHSLAVQGVPMSVVEPDKAGRTLCQETQSQKLLVVRGRSQELLALVSQLETQGVRSINRSDAIASVLNKASMAATLLKAGIPTPATFYASTQALAMSLPRSAYPLILKPVFGDNARGLRIVFSAEELAMLNWPEPIALAQTYVMSDGYDLKLYGIGDKVWAVRKPSPLSIHRNLKKRAELVPITSKLKSLSQRCGALFGLELYGVDCILTPSGPMVIEVNDFPNYTGISEANRRLADYVIRQARSPIL